MTIDPTRAYLSRNGHRVTIVQRVKQHRWTWLTSKGYYVLADGRATLVGESVKDLVVEAP